MTIRIVVLAAGKGKRMNNGGMPKVLTPLKGKPMIQYLLEAIERSEIDRDPVIVVGQGAENVKEVLGSRYTYITQDEQRGTGHAVQCAQSVLRENADAIIVLYGDHPFVHASVIKKLSVLHEREGRVITMMTTIVQNFEDWRRPFYDFGRVLRNAGGEVVGIVEKKDATDKQLAIREVNPSFFCFNGSWLWGNLSKLTNENAQKEYYLTDLVGIAIQQGERIASMDIDPFESIGVNTQEHLEIATQLA